MLLNKLTYVLNCHLPVLNNKKYKIACITLLASLKGAFREKSLISNHYKFLDITILVNSIFIWAVGLNILGHIVIITMDS